MDDHLLSMVNGQQGPASASSRLRNRPTRERDKKHVNFSMGLIVWQMTSDVLLHVFHLPFWSSQHHFGTPTSHLMLHAACAITHSLACSHILNSHYSLSHIQLSPPPSHTVTCQSVSSFSGAIALHFQWCNFFDPDVDPASTTIVLPKLQTWWRLKKIVFDRLKIRNWFKSRQDGKL